MECTIPNTDLVPEQIQHQLDDSLLLDTPFEIIISRDSIARYPEIVQKFMTIKCAINSRTAGITFPSGRVLYEFLRVLNYLETDLEVEPTCRKFIDNHFPANFHELKNTEAIFWADSMPQTLSSDDPNPILDEAFLEWILLMKLENNPSVRDLLSSSGNKILIWAHQNPDDLGKQLGMRYTSSTASYTGKNVLGKLWMRIRDNKIPLFIEEWFANIVSEERCITLNDLRTQNYAISDVDISFTPLNIGNAAYPITLGTSNHLCPDPIRQILGSFECTFPSAGNLLQFIRLLRHHQKFFGDYYHVKRHVEYVLHKFMSYDYAEIQTTPLMEPTFKLSERDVEWILKLHLAQNPEVQAALNATGDKFILVVGCEYLGMTRVEGVNASSYKGCNVAGKVWTQIRDGGRGAHP